MKPAILALLASLGASGCHQHMFSPPARMFPLETVTTPPAGHARVDLEGGLGFAALSFGVGGGTARVEVGLDDRTSLQGEGTVMHEQHDSGAGIDPNALAGRLGLKLQLGRFAALTAGIGGGGSAGGGFLSPDLGLILAYENRWVIPFLSLRGAISQPIAPRAVDLATKDQALGTVVDTPHTTFLFGGTGGLRVALPTPEPGAPQLSLLCGLSAMRLVDQRGIAETAVGASAGAQLGF